LTETVCDGYGGMPRPSVLTDYSRVKLMSIRLIARDLYRLIRKVSELEKQIGKASMERQGAMMDELRKAKVERDRLQRALDGSKESPTKRYR